jgi:hypothetical protein
MSECPAKRGKAERLTNRLLAESPGEEREKTVKCEKGVFHLLLQSVRFYGFLLSVSLELNASININVDAVQKSVVFLYAAGATGDVDASRPIGTGFWVQVPVRSDPKRAYQFLVTARHMVDPAWAKCEQPNPSVMYARVNKKNYNPEAKETGVEFVRLNLIDKGKSLWEHSTDDHIDAAVLPITADINAFDVGSIPISIFPTPQELGAQSIGDPIMSAGLMPGLTGTKRNLPIFKFGQISNIPQEDIETACSFARPPFLVKVWLIAANLVPGNSGSPMFHVPLGGSGVSFGGTRPMLLGIQSISFLGADVAGMTPISFVYEIFATMKLNDANLDRGPK